MLRRRTATSLGPLAFCGCACALALGVAVMSLPGCTDSPEDAPAREGTAFEAGAPNGSGTSTACTSCVAQECTGAWALCLTDRRCVALRGCATPFAESGSARQQCFCATAGADGSSVDAGGSVVDPLALYAAYATCNDARTCTTCSSDCVASCASGPATTRAGACGSDVGDASIGVGDASDAGDARAPDATDAAAVDASVPSAAVTAETCASCVTSKCGDAKKACALGTECSLFLACANGCAGASCVDGCEASYATGRASATELSSCTLTACRSACGL